MSLLAIRRALETALAAMTPTVKTVFENELVYKPVAGTPYIKAYLLPAQPGNDEIGPNYTQEGLLQANLFYPQPDGTNGAGPAAAMTRAEAIRTAFYRGRTLTSGGINTIIMRTPEIASAFEDGDRYVVPCRVRWFASLTT